MRVYHGTSKKKMESITKEGVDTPSYWTDSYDKAFEYAKSWGDPVVLCCDTDQYEFKANMLVAQTLFDDNEIDALPNPCDLVHSLEYLEGIVCHERVREFSVAQKPSTGPACEM